MSDLKETLIAVAKFLALITLGTVAILFAIWAICQLTEAKLACAIFFGFIALVLTVTFYIAIFDEE